MTFSHGTAAIIIQLKDIVKSLWLLLLNEAVVNIPASTIHYILQ